MKGYIGVEEMARQQYELREKFFGNPSMTNSVMSLLDILNRGISPQMGSIYKKLQAINTISVSPIMQVVDQLQKINQYTDWVNKIQGFSYEVVLSHEVRKTIDMIQSATIRNDFLYKEYEFYKSEEDQPTSEIVVNDSRRLKQIILDISKDHTKLLSIDPRAFEEIIAEMLSKQGFKVELTKQTRDNGYDIMCIASIGSNLPLKFLVECKRYTKEKVGIEIIRGFRDVISTEKANKGIIVTTSYFTKDAIQKRKETPYLLDFKDKDAVIEWVDQYCSPIISS